MERDDIIRLLMQREFVSGEYISGKLGVTRAAVWKAISAMREEGYEIESVKRRGYHLAPPDNSVWPSAIRRELVSKWAGCEIEYYRSIDSTNARAKALGREGAPHGAAVVADDQVSGRGRMARGWSAPAGKCLLMSVMVRPRGLHPRHAPQLVPVAALAVAGAIAKFGLEARIKWPNDIVIGTRKVCGTLLEMSADMDGVDFAVIGAGTNLNGYPELPGDTATSLMREGGAEICRASFAAGLLEAFEMYYDSWEAGGIGRIMGEYREKSATVGNRVKVIRQGRESVGRAIDINEDGSLRFLPDGGEVEDLNEGDVSVRGLLNYV